jgi:hypothetical protein
MPVEERPLSSRARFDQLTRDYDAMRPSYPIELIDEVPYMTTAPDTAL